MLLYLWTIIGKQGQVKRVKIWNVMTIKLQKIEKTKINNVLVHLTMFYEFPTKPIGSLISREL